MRIEDNLRIVKLIDIYGSLLTTKQYEIMSSYYFENLSLSEIGDNYNISRQAVSDCISQATKSLELYEDKLKLIDKENVMVDHLNFIIDNSDNADIVNEANKIIRILRG